MKNVVLIGDSIRMGYQASVHGELSDVAQVWGPEQNGGDSANVLAHAEEWIVLRRPDVIHINAGLHDIKRPFDSDVPQVSEADYEENLRRILECALRSAKDGVIWAMTTPVNHERHHAVKDFDRFEDDVVRRNTIAERICKELDVPVNDLYGFVMRSGRDQMLVDDGVHYTADAYVALGHRVAQTIRDYL